MLRRLLKPFAIGMLVLLMMVAGFAAWAWAPDLPVEELRDRWATPPSQFIEVGGMQVHVRDEGPRDDPVPLVLLHGTSSSLHTWDGWSEALKPARRVIRFDLPGFGLTGPSPDNDYRMQTYSQFVINMLDTLQIEQAVLAGNSLGGHIAWLTALEYPDRVQSLVLVDAAGYPFTGRKIPLGFKIALIPVVNRLARNVLPRSLVETSVRQVYGDPDKVTGELIDRYFAMTVRDGNRHALVERFRQVSGAEQSERIAELQQPALIIWGGRDQLIPPEHARHFHQDIQASRMAIFDDLGHVPHEESPQRTVEAVMAFLNPDSG